MVAADRELSDRVRVFFWVLVVCPWALMNVDPALALVRKVKELQSTVNIMIEILQSGKQSGACIGLLGRGLGVSCGGGQGFFLYEAL